MMMMMRKVWDFVDEMKPVMMMMTVMVAFGGMSVFYKVASNDGMSLRILIAYRFIFAAAFILPIALYTERKTRPKLTWMILLQAFSCALFGGSMAQNLFAESLVLTSATFATAIINLIPAFTFILALPFGLEKLGLRRRAGQAKLMGTLIGIGGAMVLTFYRGKELKIRPTQSQPLLDNRNGHVILHEDPHSHILGVLLALACVLSNAISLIIQAKMSELYPCHYSSTALITIMGSLQAAGYALCTERDWSQWKLGWNIRLLIVVYAGVVASALAICFMMCSVRMRGPLFVSAFNPFMLVCVAITSTLFLKENLYLGCVIGAVAIIVGLYMVIWGKQKEMEGVSSKLTPSTSSGDDEEEVPNEKDVNVGNNLVAVGPNLMMMLGAEEVDVDEEEKGMRKGDFNV
ncbi:PREDICTED: WAT1-related protein At1g25270-like [Ipomoea nil]|uniref:WAT1-related protein At1g25270-like n=1 Tax=Ipomoea nil TaxID=35883 RepID=UPI000901BEA7|nr:PREDICTED: WAT1-related protein At1g25270-like [Ipomoea nil]XP_019169029.1 PREDICTED: WAT1-related protein At1g25270-like [Ipomoea nil]